LQLRHRAFRAARSGPGTTASSTRVDLAPGHGSQGLEAQLPQAHSSGLAATVGTVYRINKLAPFGRKSGASLDGEWNMKFGHAQGFGGQVQSLHFWRSRASAEPQKSLPGYFLLSMLKAVRLKRAFSGMQLAMI
jgi:hypothetical protein